MENSLSNSEKRRLRDVLIAFCILRSVEGNAEPFCLGSSDKICRNGSELHQER